MEPLTAEGLRAWAKGIYPTEAAAELLIRAYGGTFAYWGKPWIRELDSGDGYWIDTEAIAAAGYLSGGERRFLSIVASLLDDEHPVNLGDVLSGLDRETVVLVLAAVSHASGSHEHSGIRVNPVTGVAVHGPMPGSLYPWPEGDV